MATETIQATSPVYVLTEAKLQSMVTAIMRQVNVRINDFIDTNPIAYNSRADKIASPKAVYDSLKTVEAVIPVLNENKLAVSKMLIPNPTDKSLYVIVESEDDTEGTPYIYIPDDDPNGEGRFIKVCKVDETEQKYEHNEFTDEQITNIISAAVSATEPTFE